MPQDPLPPWLTAARLATGSRIREARRHANLSQQRLGELAGMDRQTVSRIELGTTSARLDRILWIARALDVPPASLLPNEPPD